MRSGSAIVGSVLLFLTRCGWVRDDLLEYVAFYAVAAYDEYVPFLAVEVD